MDDAKHNDGPTLIRPIPRRPFDAHILSPTPPDEEPSPSISVSDLRFLDPRQNAGDPDSISRTASFMNLTSSTLFGIYSPMSPGRDRLFDERDEPATPWGTGAETPAKRPDLDDQTYELMRERSGKRAKSPQAPALREQVPVTPMSLALRAVLLFALGIGYGVLVTRLPSKQDLSSFGVDDLIKNGHNWGYLAFWGVAGVALGTLLPWFDGVWEESFGGNDTAATAANDNGGSTDWALVIRGIGAFAGIVFAIRRLPWASTMQVSLSLALANPFIWYLIDRSKTGFLLSTAVGITGSAVLMGFDPDVMPAPAGLSLYSLYQNGTNAGQHNPPALGGLASQETVETVIWMLSVLFCSCVCFGNIGRRLAMNKKATARGRWAGVR